MQRFSSLLFLPAALVLMLSLGGCALQRPPPLELLGMPASVGAAQRTIVLQPDTRWVNVEGGEIIRFVVGERSFAWNFFVGTSIASFPLNRVAPPGLLPQEVRVYVEPDPRYRDLEGEW